MAQPDDTSGSMAWYAQRKPVFTGGNQVRLLRGATEMLPEQAQAIDAAKSSVWMATYLVSDQGSAAQVLSALQRAAQRGVAVHMVVDGVGSGHMAESVWQKLRQSGVNFAIYRPVGRWWSLVFDRAQWRRMHVKLCVVDNQLAFAGGINLIDDHFDLSHGWSTQPRLDYAVQFTGPCVTPALHTIRAMWTRATLGRDWRDDLTDLAREPKRAQRIRQLWRSTRLGLTPAERQRVARQAKNEAPMRAAFVLRDNLRQRRTIERAALSAILQSRQRIDIATPYFYPGRALRRALRQAAARGVAVRLLFQGKPDYQLAALAARVLYDELQQHGVRIFEYQNAWLHAKVLCVDDEWATVGSSNLDPLSLLFNLEANLIVQDRAFAQTMAKALAEDFAHSREIPHPEVMQGATRSRLSGAVLAWCAKFYLRVAGIVRRY